MASAMTEGIRASGHCRSYAHPSAVRPRQFTTPPALRATSPYTGEALATAFDEGALTAQLTGNTSQALRASSPQGEPWAISFGDSSQAPPPSGRAMRASTVHAFGRGLRRIGRAARAGG